MRGYFLEDDVIMGDELMFMFQNNEINNQIFRNYIEKEKAKFMFGCTTRLVHRNFNNIFFFRETKFIKSQEADGILGLGINSNSFFSNFTKFFKISI